MRHEPATHAFDALLDGVFGQPFVTEYIVDETVTLTLARTDSHEAAVEIGHRLLGVDPYPDVFGLVPVTGDRFDDGWGVFTRYPDQDLSFTDAVSIACMNFRSIEDILSFDDNFDGIVSRIASE